VEEGMERHLLAVFVVVNICWGASISIDGSFVDWSNVPSHYDPDDNEAGTVLQDGVVDCHEITPGYVVNTHLVGIFSA
jgi:hypothetical protein